MATPFHVFQRRCGISRPASGTCENTLRRALWISGGISGCSILHYQYVCVLFDILQCLISRLIVMWEVPNSQIPISPFLRTWRLGGNQSEESAALEEWTEGVVITRYRFTKFGLQPLLLCLVWHTRDRLIHTSVTIRHTGQKMDHSKRKHKRGDHSDETHIPDVPSSLRVLKRFISCISVSTHGS
jgi:hypothetical protein